LWQKLDWERNNSIRIEALETIGAEEAGKEGLT